MKISGPAWLTTSTLHHGIRMPRDSASQPDRVAHHLGVFTQLDAAANGHRIAFHGAVNQDAPEDRDRVAGGAGHANRAADTHNVAHRFVGVQP